MNEEYEQNDSNINDFQEELNNDFKQESMNNSEEENELEDDTYQYIADIKEMAQKDFSKYINKQLTPNRTANNKLVNNLWNRNALVNNLSCFLTKNKNFSKAT